MQHTYPLDAWCIRETSFDVTSNFLDETLFALGNGYIGLRGTPEEGYAGPAGTSLDGSYLPAMRMFYLATLGAARSLHLDDTIGSFAAGREADFIVIDPQATPLLARRSANTDSLEEQLFALALLGDDRAIAATYSGGRLVHARAQG